MSSQSYGSSNEPNIARSNPPVNNDETQALSYDSAWRPDYDPDYGTPVQQYSGPGNFPATPPPTPQIQPMPTPPQPAQHPYAQAAQNLPVQDYYGNSPQGYQQPQGYIQPGYNATPTPYAPVTIYRGDQQMTPPLQKQAEYQPNQTYTGYAPPEQTYNGQPLPPNASPSSGPAPEWLMWLIGGIIVISVLSSLGFWSWWPFWIFILWSMGVFGGRSRWRGRGRWRGRNRWGRW